MILIDLGFVLLLALAISVLLAVGFGWRHPAHPGPWPAFVFLLVTMLFLTWAGGTWIGRIGPVYREFAWLPFVLMALLATLTLLAAAPARPLRRQRDAGSRQEPRAVFGLSFWILILALAAVIAVRYAV